MMDLEFETTDVITSDLHFGHANIIKFCNRPFDDVDEMALALIEEINIAGARTWILGDFAFLSRTRLRDVLDLIEVDLVLVQGNHDSKVTVNEFSARGFPVMTKFRTRIANRSVDFSHYPFQDERYPERCLPDKGQVLVHGHVHDKWKIKGRQINVGWDAWHKILTYKDLDFSIRSMVR